MISYADPSLEWPHNVELQPPHHGSSVSWFLILSKQKLLWSILPREQWEQFVFNLKQTRNYLSKRSDCESCSTFSDSSRSVALRTNLTIFIPRPSDSPFKGLKRTRLDYSLQKLITEYLLTLLPEMAETLR